MLLVAEPTLGDDEKTALAETVDSGWITMGERAWGAHPRYDCIFGVPSKGRVLSGEARTPCSYERPA